jgi:hypothetical protein
MGSYGLRTVTPWVGPPFYFNAKMIIRVYFGLNCNFFKMGGNQRMNMVQSFQAKKRGLFS